MSAPRDAAFFRAHFIELQPGPADYAAISEACREEASAQRHAERDAERDYDDEAIERARVRQAECEAAMEAADWCLRDWIFNW